jgi:hypothetical protein
MPDPQAILTPDIVTINPNATTWTALEGSSGTCYADGCGSTGWVESIYTIATAGTFKLQFGVTNWTDGFFDSGMAIAGANIGGVAIDPDDPINPSPVPLPAGAWLLLTGLGGMAALRGRRKSRVTPLPKIAKSVNRADRRGEM